MKCTSAQRRDTAKLAQRQRDAEIEADVVDEILLPLTDFPWMMPIDYDAPEAWVRANYQYVIAPSTPVRFPDPVAGVNVDMIRQDEEAGVDIPCKTPNSLLYDTPAATPASTITGQAPKVGSNIGAGASKSEQGGGVHGMAVAAVATPDFALALAPEADAPVNVSTATTPSKSFFVLSPSNTKEETADDSFPCRLNANSGASGGHPFVGAEEAVLPKAFGSSITNTEAETNGSFFESWLNSRSNANSKGNVNMYVAL
jgi:hypothetical protein